MTEFDEKNWSKYLEDDPVDKLGDTPVEEAQDNEIVMLPTKADINKEDVTPVLMEVITAYDTAYTRRLQNGYNLILKMIPELMAG